MDTPGKAGKTSAHLYC